MKQPAAFRGTYSDWRLVKTRAVVQVIFEVPLSDADAAYEVLGGMPVHGKERWFGIAAIDLSKPEAAAKRDHMDWRDVQPAAQAGIRCADPMFRAFLSETRGFGASTGEIAAVAVRDVCGVRSRSELSTNQKARVIWHQLDTEFQAWKLVSA